MASVLLAANHGSNEPNWTPPSQPRAGAKFMGKLPFSNPNPNPKLSKKRQFQAAVDAPPPPHLIMQSAAASDDALSINGRPNDFNGYVTFNIASYSRKELAELKNQLVAELEQIRKLKNRIESSDLQIRSGGPNFKKSSIKKISGNKRPFPPSASSFGFGGGGPKDMKRSVNNNNNNNKNSNHNPVENSQLLKKCGQILTKLMKHKHGYIFNVPVDVEGMKLHDYFDIIKNPMDLGTVKLKLGKNLYDSPTDFAAEVRLTFNNAMKYNPKGHEVYALAEQLMSRFKELYRPIRDKVGDVDVDQDQDQVIEVEQVQEVQASSWDHNHVDRMRKDQENVIQVMGNSDPIGKSMVVPQSMSQLPVRTPSPMRVPPVKPVKLPKPKAKDPNKRDMSLEEKHKLGIGLQSLPQEKMEQVVQIIRKRNGHLRQEGDEIELDIEAVDTETLWELDRFVTNYKKMASKIKRQALMGINNSATAVCEGGNKEAIGNERMDVVTEAKKPKKGDTGDEDVDIGDEMPMSSFPPVEIEKDNGHASSSSSGSSSSSSGSSSSSDSDSGSSSGSDSEDAHS